MGVGSGCCRLEFEMYVLDIGYLRSRLWKNVCDLHSVARTYEVCTFREAAAAIRYKQSVNVLKVSRGLKSEKDERGTRS